MGCLECLEIFSAKYLGCMDFLSWHPPPQTHTNISTSRNGKQLFSSILSVNFMFLWRLFIKSKNNSASLLSLKTRNVSSTYLLYTDGFFLARIYFFSLFAQQVIFFKSKLQQVFLFKKKHFKIRKM